MILNEVGVLEFVHHHVSAEILIGRQHLWEPLEQDRNEMEEILKIQGIVSAKVFLVSLVDQRQAFLKDVKLGRLVLVRSDPVVFQFPDGRQKCPGRIRFGVQIQLLHHRLQMPFLILFIIDDKILVKPKMSICLLRIRTQAE